MKNLIFIFCFCIGGISLSAQSNQKSNGNQGGSQPNGDTPSTSAAKKSNTHSGGGGSFNFTLDEYTACVRMCNDEFDGNANLIETCIKGCGNIEKSAVKPATDKTKPSNDKVLPVKKN